MGNNQAVSISKQNDNWQALACRSLALKYLNALELGQLRINLPGGETLSFGLGAAPSGEIYVNDDSFFKKCLLYGDIGFGESYVDGVWDSPDLVPVFQWL